MASAFVPNIEISVTIDLSDVAVEDLEMIAQPLASFVEHARQIGARIEFGPTPDQIDAELAILRDRLSRVIGGANVKVGLRTQITRIEGLNRFRRQAEVLLNG